MTKDNNRPVQRILYFLMLAILLSSQSLMAQTVLYAEDFNDCALPSGWTVDAVGNQDPVWYVGMPQNPNSDGSTIDGSCMLIIDDDATGDNTPPFTLQLRSPSFDGTGFEKIDFDIDVHFRSVEDSYLRIYVDDGNTLHTIANFQGYGDMTGQQFSEFQHVTADLSFYASANMSIVIEYDDNDVWAWWAGVDNIEVIGEGEGSNVILETFNDCAAPTDWNASVLNGVDNWQFGYVDNTNAWAANSMNGSCFAYFDDDGIGEDAPFSAVRLYSPQFNGAEFAEFKLSFDLILRRVVQLEHLAIYVFDGVDHHLVETFYDDIGGPQFNEHQNISLDLTPYRSEQMQIVFHYEDGNGWGWWVGLDNIKVTGSGQTNDICSNAIPINLGDPCLEGNNLTAIFSGDAASCFDDNVGSLWYQYESTTTGILKIETGADFNDLITVFEGDCNGMTEVDCNNRDEHGFTGETHYMDVTAGTDYLIRVTGINARFGRSRGDLCISLETAAAYPTPPVNDLCNNAISLIPNSGDCVDGNNYNATFSGPEPSLNIKSRADIWYSFTATEADLEIKTQADFADVISVYNGNCNLPIEIAVNEFGQSLQLHDLNIGSTYFVQISGFFATVEGNLCMSVESIDDGQANNDLCPDATYVNVDGSCVMGDNTFANFEGPVPSCTVAPSANIWFEFTAPASGAVQMNTGSSFPHVLAIYNDDCDNLEEVFCIENPTFCSGYFDVLFLNPGANYLIQIASEENNFGYLMGDLCLSILDIGSNETFDPLELVITANCIEPGISILNVETTGGVGNYDLIGNNTGDTLYTGESFFTIVSDELGCEVSVAGIVNCGVLPCQSGASFSSTDIDCYNGSDGTAAIDVSAGENGPFVFQWSNGSSSSTISNLVAGDYSVTVTDAVDCSKIFAFTIEEPAPLLSNALATGETGTNTNDGTATTSPQGGTPPYSISWNTGATSPTINNLAPGNYTVTITDANDCITIETVIVSDFNCAINVSIDSDNISCFGNTDGQAAANVSNGNAPFTYIWSNGAITETIENLAVGSYAVTVTDVNGCPSAATIFITEPTEVEGIVVSIIDVLCSSTATGIATVSANGGTAPYTYAWPDGSSGPMHSSLLAGTYTITASDANGCFELIDIELDEPSLLESTIAESTDIDCFGNDNGSATVFPMGGTQGYTFLWSDALAQTTSTANNLLGGDYTVTVTDMNGCTSVSAVNINQPDEIIVSIDNIIDEIGSMSNGSIEVSVSGGTGPLAIDWILAGSGVGSDEDLYNITAGNYTIIVTDSTGCVLITDDIIVGNLVAVNDPILEDAVRILPNPTNGAFWVEIDLDTERQIQISIFDVLGRQIINTEKEKHSQKTYPFDLRKMVAGVYPVRIYLDGDVVVKLIVLVEDK